MSQYSKIDAALFGKISTALLGVRLSKSWRDEILRPVRRKARTCLPQMPLREPARVQVLWPMHDEIVGHEVHAGEGREGSDFGLGN